MVTEADLSELAECLPDPLRKIIYYTYRLKKQPTRTVMGAVIGCFYQYIREAGVMVSNERIENEKNRLTKSVGCYNPDNVATM